MLTVGYTIADYLIGVPFDPESASVILASISLAFLGLMALYTRYYVSALEARGSEFILKTAGILEPVEHRFRRENVRSVNRYEGRNAGYGSSTPWLTLRIAGRAWPFILDLGAEQVQEHLILSLAGITSDDLDEPTDVPEYDSNEAQPAIRHVRELVADEGLMVDSQFLHYDFSSTPFSARASFDDDGIVLVTWTEGMPPELSDLPHGVLSYLQYRFDEIRAVERDGEHLAMWSRE